MKLIGNATIAIALSMSIIVNTSGVFSEGSETNTYITQINAMSEDTNSIKKCGDNLFWNIESNTLEITGHGEMYDYSVYTPAPWKEYSFNSVMFSEGVTSIGAFAFFNSSLEEVLITENKIQNIGYKAFYNSRKLNKITFDKNCAIEEIQDYAFQNCISLNKFEFPDNLNKLGKGVFCGCSNLNEVFINSKIDALDDCVFQKCAIIDIVIPENVRKIGEETFSECDALKKIQLSSMLREIPYKAFYGCESLNQVVIPYSTVKIGEKAFENCKSLSNVYIQNNLRAIKNKAFSNCTSIREITIPNITSNISKDAFENSNLTIYANTNSYAETYAKDNNLNYINSNVSNELSKDNNPSNLTIYGDLNKDSIVDICDLSIMALYIIGDIHSFKNEEFVADLDFDNNISLPDLAYLRQYISHVRNDSIFLNEDLFTSESDIKEILNDFSDSIITSNTVLSDSYINNMYFTVKSINDDSAILSITVPDIATIVDDATKLVMKENKESDYEALLYATKKKVKGMMLQDQYLLKKDISLDVIKDIDGEEKLQINDEFIMFISDSIFKYRGNLNDK